MMEDDEGYIFDKWLLDTDCFIHDHEDRGVPYLTREQHHFLDAVSEGTLNHVSSKIAEGFNINFCLYWRANPLCTAVDNGRLEIAKLLLNSGAHIGCALHLACFRSNIDMVSMLLSFGADPNALGHGLGKDVSSCLVYALHVTQPVSIVVKLIDAGAIANAMCARTLWTPLHLCCNSLVHNHDMALAVLRGGGMASHKDMYPGLTPLEHAARRSDKRIIQLLIDAGYPVHGEALPIKELHQNLVNDIEFMGFMRQTWSSPFTLKQMCAVTIRSYLGGCNMQHKVLRLPLPKSIQKFISLETLI